MQYKPSSVLLIALILVGAGCVSAPQRPEAAPLSVTDGDRQANAVPSVPTYAKRDLSGRGLTEVDQSVFLDTGIEELDLSNNALTGSLPAEIRHLSHLRVLDASDNMMTGVPAEVGQLGQLEVLDLSNNALTGLPYELGNLKSLRILDLRGNDVSSHDLEVIRNNLSGTDILL